MKIKLLFIAFFAFFLQNSFSQTVTLDSSFGIGGKVIKPFNPNGDSFGSIVVQPDGKIIYVGLNDFSLNGNIFVSRFNIDGTLDTNFGNNGIVNTQLITETGSNSIVKLQSDGKILITASYSTSNNNDFFDFATVRYNSDGSIDTNFGVNGIVITDFNNKGDVANAIDLQSDGKIIVAGWTYTNNNTRIVSAIVRYLANGMLDTTFGVNGKSILGLFDPNKSDFVKCIKVLSDDSIVLGVNTAAQETLEDYLNFGIIKINSNGTLDSTFGFNGHVFTDFGYKDYINSIGEYDGKIIALGYSVNPNISTKMAIVKYLSNGNLDTTFGVNGIINSNSNATSTFDATLGMLIQNDGSIISAGYTAVSSSADFLLIKFTNDGILDTQFNTIGFLTTDFDNNIDIAGNIAVGIDGKVVSAGLTRINSIYQTAFARYTIGNLSNLTFAENSFTSYPNPFTNSITLNSNDSNSVNSKIELFDINGRKLNDFILDTNSEIKFDDGLSKGNYFLRITNNDKVETIKILKN